MADLPTPGIPSLQLLLIQPDRALGASLSLALDEIGHTVTMVDRISAGTLGWVDDFIDLVILDLDEVGPEVKFFLRCLPRPVVVCTRRTDPSFAEELRPLHVSSVLLKPFKMQVLYAAVARGARLGTLR